MAEARSEASWARLSRSRTHELVIDAIEQQIMSGALSVGDPLPPERQLATSLQVSRAGVREALRVLEGQGVLVSRVGSGPDAGTFVADATGVALTRLLRLHVGLSNFPISDLVYARSMLECSSAALAAEHADERALEAMRESLDAMERTGASREEFNDADTAFHLAIAEAGGNRLVADMTSAVRSSLRAAILEAFRQVDDWPGLVEQLRAQHRAIYEAIAASDPARASDVMESHIRASFAAMPGLRSPGR